MSNNVNKVAVSTTEKEKFVNSFDYKVCNTRNLEFLETEWLTSRRDPVSVIMFSRKNILIPIITEGGRLLIKNLESTRYLNDFLGSYNDKLLNSRRPKAIVYLKYFPQKYKACSPKQYIAYKYDYFVSNGRGEEIEKLSKYWQEDLALLTFIDN